jgi:hypothetical protein
MVASTSGTTVSNHFIHFCCSSTASTLEISTLHRAGSAVAKQTIKLSAPILRRRSIATKRTACGLSSLYSFKLIYNSLLISMPIYPCSPCAPSRSPHSDLTGWPKSKASIKPKAPQLSKEDLLRIAHEIRELPI